MRQFGIDDDVNERIEGLINQTEKNKFEELVKSLGQDLLDEGFDEYDILGYLTERLEEAYSGIES